MNDKMKAEFGIWYLTSVVELYGKGVHHLAETDLAWLREDGSYSNPMLRLALMAWQASRAAIEVELPSAYQNPQPYACYEGGWNDMRGEAVDNIESLGLKVKGG